MSKCVTSWKTMPAMFTGQRNHNATTSVQKEERAKFPAGLIPAKQRLLDQEGICPPERKSSFLPIGRASSGLVLNHWGTAEDVASCFLDDSHQNTSGSQRGFAAAEPFSSTGICTDQALYWNESRQSLSGHQGP